MKQVLRVLLKKAGIFKIARQVYHVFSPKGQTELDFLSRLVQTGEPVHFLQIGAHDGRTGDHLYELIKQNKWRGIFFEPVEYLFQKLVKNYEGSDGLYFENKAISSSTGIRNFFRLRPNNDGLPEWYDQLGSFKKEVILSHKSAIPNIESYLVEEEVECITIADAVEKHGFKQVELLLIDTEGADFEILKSVDFNSLRPKVIIYEHAHLCPKDEDECALLLRGKGYNLLKLKNSNNTVAFRSITTECAV